MTPLQHELLGCYVGVAIVFFVLGILIGEAQGSRTPWLGVLLLVIVCCLWLPLLFLSFVFFCLEDVIDWFLYPDERRRR